MKNFKERLTELEDEYRQKVKALMQEKREQEKTDSTPQLGDSYFYILDNGVIGLAFWHDNKFDRERLEYENVFITLEDAKDEVKETKIRRELKKWKRLHDSKKATWGAGSDSKFFIVYDYINEKLESQGNYCCKHNDIYFSSEEIANECIKEFEDDLTWLLTR